MQIIYFTLLMCCHGIGSWPTSRDPLFYQRSYNNDYYTDIPENDTIGVGEYVLSDDEVTIPFFGKTPRLVEGTIGQAVVISCIVYNLGESRVAWMRIKDLQILTLGPLRFTSDRRVSCERSYQDSTRWDLVIRDLRLDDSGRYECQVNSSPEIKLKVELVVREEQQSDMPFESPGQTVIEGPRKQVVKQGTVVIFVCTARHYFSKSDHSHSIVWLKDGEPIDKSETNGGGVNVLTVWRSNSVNSQLSLITASSTNNGVYSCTVPGSGTDKVTLFIEGKQLDTSIYSNGQSNINAISTLMILVFSNFLNIC